MRPWTWRISSQPTPEQPPDRPLFALDQNFPEPILREAIALWLPDIEIRALREIDPELTYGREDWEVIIGLAQRGIEGFITCDASMLGVAPVIAVIEQSRLSVVVCDRVGHDPVVATGLLLTHLQQIANHHHVDRAQVWRLRPAERTMERVEDLKNRIFERSGLRVEDYRVSPDSFQPPLFS